MYENIGKYIFKKVYASIFPLKRLYHFQNMFTSLLQFTSNRSTHVCLFFPHLERLTINLTNGCYGEVIVNGKERVCARGWTDFMSHTLCLNLGCSNAVSASPSDTLPTGPLHHFSCTGSEVRLLQCASQKSTCNSKPVSVICSGMLPSMY